jgi:NADPH:quinone reductase-like Zn-dependent oxidoreductase
MLGGVSVALTRGGSKRHTLLAAGAQHVIATEDLVAEVRKITDGKGARINGKTRFRR